MNISKEVLAYLAGFFDGEGCISFIGDTPHINISVSQTVKEPLELFARYFQGNIHCGRKKTKGGLSYYRFRVGNRKGAGALLLPLLPYLKGKHEGCKVLELERSLN